MRPFFALHTETMPPEFVLENLDGTIFGSLYGRHTNPPTKKPNSTRNAPATSRRKAVCFPSAQRDNIESVLLSNSFFSDMILLSFR